MALSSGTSQNSETSGEVDLWYQAKSSGVVLKWVKRWWNDNDPGEKNQMDKTRGVTHRHGAGCRCRTGDQNQDQQGKRGGRTNRPL